MDHAAERDRDVAVVQRRLIERPNVALSCVMIAAFVTWLMAICVALTVPVNSIPAFELTMVIFDNVIVDVVEPSINVSVDRVVVSVRSRIVPLDTILINADSLTAKG